MNLFGFNIRISRQKEAVPAPARRLFDPQAWLKGDDVGNGGPALSNAYEQVVWVYRAINVLAEQVANIPFVFSAGERGKENLITSGPLLDFYNRPHPQLTRFQYWELRVIWLMLRGECFRVPIYEDEQGRLSFSSGNSLASGRHRLRRVLMLDPARFQHIVEDHRLIGWRYTGFGPRAPLASQVFLPEEVWFEKLPNPFDFWRGFPPLFVAEMAARTDYAAGLFMRGIIENNADTGVIVRTDKWLSDEQRSQIVAALTNRKRTAGVADRPVLLLGTAEVIKPQLSSTDLQFLENRKFSRAEICAAFGVPEEVVTSTEHAKYDVMAGARLNFIENRVAPLCSRLEAAEDITVKSVDPAASGWFDVDSLPIMQEARRNRLAAARTGFEMGVPLNELNRVLDLGFKPLPWGDQGFVNGTLRQVGEEGKAEGRNPKLGGRHQKHETAEFAEARDPFARAARLLEGLGREEFSAQLSQLPVDDQFLSRLRRFLFEQRGRVLEKLAAFPARACVLKCGTPAPQAAMESAVGITPKPCACSAVTGHMSAEQLIEQVFNLPEEDSALARRLAPRAAADSDQAGPGGTPSAGGQHCSAPSSVRRFNETIRTALLETLRPGLGDSGDVHALAVRVRSWYNQDAESLIATAARDLARGLAVAAPSTASLATP